ncbi:MAG: amidophosphoribosyltransferase [Deinococcales bacterium]
MMDKPQDKCGVFGIYAPGEEVARLSFFGLHALQHRGQESAGIASSDGQVAHVYKAMGLVSQVFNEENLSTLPGHLAIGHTRYSTTGSSKLRNAQPLLIETVLGPLGIAHNGNLTNVPMLRRELLQQGVGLSTSSDTEVIVQLLAGGRGDWFSRLRSLMAQAEGAYALTILTRDAIYGLRDPWGFRPLCIGDYKGKGYVLASESCALGTIGASLIDEVKPGEIVRIDKRGLHREQGAPGRKISLCTFEHIYFARPDSIFAGRVIHSIRQNLGKVLAQESPAEANAVIAVPDSGTPAAIGYAQELGIHFTEGLTKNRYIARTFIQPSDEQRKNSVKLKFNPLPDNLKGKRVVVVDDSIVRGNTVKPLIQMVREGGASEVHVRVSSPPIKHPCFMGVDMASQEELIAHHYTVAEIAQKVGADSLAFISLEGMMKAIMMADLADHATGYCNACFTGNYPISLEGVASRGSLEQSLA